MSNIREDKKYYYVYKTINDINNKEYIGFHSTDDLEDGYIGSGKLLLFAIKKYGIEHFHKTILKIFDNKTDAETYERELVNADYVNRSDTYNISLGGNVGIVRKDNEKFYKNRRPFENGNLIIDGIKYNSFSAARCKLNISKKQLEKLLLKDGNGYIDENFQKQFLEYIKYKEIVNEIAKQRHIEAIRRATKNPERNRKISEAISGRKTPWNLKTNKDPEKIRKTAEKHRGMKRSLEARKHMSDAQKKYFESHPVKNKGMIWIHNPNTNERMYINRGETIPKGWELGLGSTKKKGKKWYYNPVTKESNIFSKDEIVPEGWIPGNPHLFKIKK